jgi:hypothetical protein
MSQLLTLTFPENVAEIEWNWDIWLMWDSNSFQYVDMVSSLSLGGMSD